MLLELSVVYDRWNLGNKLSNSYDVLVFNNFYTQWIETLVNMTDVVKYWNIYGEFYWTNIIKRYL